jgi:hypothetical protein
VPLDTVKRAIKAVLPGPMLGMAQRCAAAIRQAGGAPPRFADLQSNSSSGLKSGEGNDDLVSYFNLVLSFDHRNPVALDRAHNMLVAGMVLSKKPKAVVELGVGSGYLSASLAYAIRYNGVGQLTSVDNWYDTQGQEPPIAKQLRVLGVNVVCSGEEEFVRSAPTDAYDMLISDADHYRSPEWLDQHLRIVKHDGLLFFHDTNQPEAFPALATLEGTVRGLGLPYYHFIENSRPDEHCDRGWLFVINKKPPPAFARSIT